MKVTFVLPELKQRLTLLSTVAKKSQEALYRNIRVFTDENGIVNLQSIDIDTTMTLKLPAAKADGKVNLLLDYTVFGQIVQATPDSSKTVEIESEDETDATLFTDELKAQLTTYPTEKFTELPIVAGIAEKPAFGGYVFGLPGLRDQIEAVEFAVPASEGRHVVASALLQSTGKELSLIGTTGIVLTMSTIPSALGEFSFTVPKSALEIIKKLEGGKDVTISETEGAFFFETETELVTYNKTHAEFPPYQAILPKPGDAATVITFKEKDQLIAKLNRIKPLCSSLADEKSVPVNMSYDGKGAVAFLASKEEKSATIGSLFRDLACDDLAVEGTGPAILIRFDISMMLPFFERATFPISMYLKSNHNIADMHAASGTPEKPTYRHLLMPMRFNSGEGITTVPMKFKNKK